MIINKKKYYFIGSIVIVLYITFSIFYYIKMSQDKTSPVTEYKSFIIAKTNDAFKLEIQGLGYGAGDDNKIIQAISAGTYMAQIQSSIKQNFSDRKECFFQSKKDNPLKMFLTSDAANSKQVILDFKFLETKKQNMENCLKFIHFIINQTNNNIVDALLLDIDRIIYFEMVEQEFLKFEDVYGIKKYKNLLAKINEEFDISLDALNDKYKVNLDVLSNKKGEQNRFSMAGELNFLSFQLNMQKNYTTKVQSLMSAVNLKLDKIKISKGLETLYKYRSKKETELFRNLILFQIIERSHPEMSGYKFNKEKNITIYFLGSLLALVMLIILHIIYRKQIDVAADLKKIF